MSRGTEKLLNGLMGTTRDLLNDRSGLPKERQRAFENKLRPLLEAMDIKTVQIDLSKHDEAKPMSPEPGPLNVERRKGAAQQQATTLQAHPGLPGAENLEKSIRRQHMWKRLLGFLLIISVLLAVAFPTLSALYLVQEAMGFWRKAFIVFPGTLAMGTGVLLCWWSYRGASERHRILERRFHYVRVYDDVMSRSATMHGASVSARDDLYLRQLFTDMAAN